MGRILLMSPERVRRTLRRLAAEILERNRGADTLEIIGIRHRGYQLAAALADLINQAEGASLRALPLDVAPYRDDRATPARPPEPPLEADLNDRDVILVDDVLFTGRTARAALDAIVHAGRPRSIQLVVLIDRGHREYPIQPTYVGRVIPTKHRERVVVEAEEGFAVYLEE